MTKLPFFSLSLPQRKKKGSACVEIFSPIFYPSPSTYFTLLIPLRSQQTVAAHVFFHLISQTLTNVNQGRILHNVNLPKPFLSSILSFSPWHPMLFFTLCCCFVCSLPTFLYFCLLLILLDQAGRTECLSPICYTVSHFLAFYRLNIFYRHFNIFLKILFFSFSRILLMTVTHTFAKQGQPCPAPVHAAVSILSVNVSVKPLMQSMKKEKGVTCRDAP